MGGEAARREIEVPTPPPVALHLLPVVAHFSTAVGGMESWDPTGPIGYLRHVLGVTTPGGLKWWLRRWQALWAEQMRQTRKRASEG